MKRFVFSLLLTLLLPIVASADVDLSSMSYDELVALRDQLNLAIWNSSEWESVVVPYGVWKVGEDIPAGLWTIGALDGAFVGIEYGSDLNESGMGISYRSKNYYVQTIVSKTSYSYTEGMDTSRVDIELKEGNYFCVTSGDALFVTYSGKPALGFKKK